MAMHRYLGNLYNRQTLVDQLQQAETLSEVAAKTVAVDPGYRGWHAIDAISSTDGRSLASAKRSDCAGLA